MTATVDDPDLMALVAKRVLAAAAGKTADELARHARDTLKRLDPTGTQRRARATRADADVALFEGEDGMGDVAIHAPIEDAVLIKTAITLPLRAALGLDDLPGEVPGLGIIPRQVIAEMIRAELPKLRLLVIDPESGRLLHRATSSYPHPVGPTAIGNLIPLDRTWHRGKTRGELTTTVDNSGQVYLTTASGQSRTVTPYDYRMTEPPSRDPQQHDQ